MPSKRKISTFLTTRTAKLAGTYLAIIMLMSVSFSVIFYNSTTRPLNRPAPSSDVVSPFGQRAFLDSQVQQVIEERFAEARQELTLRLVWINLSILVLGAGVSYVLARLSLSPIEEAMEAQSQFISDASHELRTPLTVLQSTNEVALRRKKLTLTDARDLIEYNLAETKKMKELSNTLLELLKDDSKEATFSKVNLQDVTSEALQSIVSYAQSRDISINDKVQPTKVRTNKQILAQLLGVLLSNAVQYSDNGSAITLKSKVVANSVRISVVDKGIGIRAVDLPHIFQRFYRADKSRTNGDSPGYGLGLAIADKLSKKINAKIDVTSKPGSGSTFTVVLPLKNH
jgi:two-component system, OmpR family, sensor histidine kinase CiaH|tara:strand:- start:2662 stop:3690 length:1029 start_codon:yes stop_codon:yes gene_type:complete